MVTQSATLQVLALQQTLWRAGKPVLRAHPETAEFRFAARGSGAGPA